MHRQQISRSSSSDELSSRVLIHSAEKTSQHTLPISIIPSSAVTTTTTTRSTTHTQTIGETPLSKPNPSFAETQLLSVYYPSQNPKNPPLNDQRIFVEQQDRTPIRFRTAYNPSAPSKSTQTPALSTHGSTLIIDGKSDPGQYLKIHSGTQHLSDELPASSSSNELVEQSRYTYEEYFVNLQEKQTRTSSSSSSSVTTVIAQNEELDSESSLSTDPRISGWPPVPGALDQEDKRPSRVQFAEKLVHVIPVSVTNSLTEVPVSPPPVLPRTNVNDPTHPTNQSKWVKSHIENSDVSNSTKSTRVNTLRSLFEQQNTHSTTLTNPVRPIEPEEKPSKHGVEIRFRVNDPHVHHAEPAKVIPNSTTPFTLDQIQQITGKQFQNFDHIGRYLSDGHTWQWDEVFWLGLTTSQRDQFKDLEQRVLSRQNSFDNSISSSPSSTAETKRFKSTMSITGTGSRPTNKSSSVLTKYTEVNTIDETQPSTTVFGSTPTIRVDSEESNHLTTRNDSQITMNESGYNSADDQTKFRPHSHPIIEESTDSKTNLRKIDPLSYEQFLIDYLSTHAKPIRSNDGTLTLAIDEQQIHLLNVRFPSSKENSNISQTVYLDAINYDFRPFETESDQLVIFFADETILVPTDRWLFYRKKYHQSKWIATLKRINRDIPVQLIPSIEHWLSEHAILELTTRRVHLDGVIIPLIGRLEQLSDSKGLLKYFIRIGCVSYDANEKLVRIGNSELDVQRLLQSPSKELVERLARHLRLLDIHFHNDNGTLIINEDFIIPNKYVEDLFEQHQQGETLNAQEIAEILLQICQIDAEEILTLSFDNQILRFINEDHRKFLIQWLEQLNELKLIDITEHNDIIINPNHPEQEIFIKHEHVNAYMDTKSRSKQTEIINMNDIASILILYKYVQYSSGQLRYRNQPIELESKEFLWLKSTIRSIRTIEHTQQTEIELFDGQILQIPYDSMSPTKNTRIIADYLYRNGEIQYDTNTRHYTYHYQSLDDSVERIKQREFLSSQIRHIYIDEHHQKIEIEFFHDPYHSLLLPSNWYPDIVKHRFDRLYIIEMLFDNGAIIKDDALLFNQDSYSLKFSSKQREKLIDFYVEFINNQGGIKLDNMTNLLLLENPFDGSELYLTQEHTEFIHQNQYRRQDMKYLLNKYSEIKQDQFGNWLLYYNNQCIQLPSTNSAQEQPRISPSKSRSHQTHDPNLKLLFPENKSLRLIQKTASTTTLDIEQPNEGNNYAIDPLLMLANYVHRAATLYQDEFGRLVIKLNRDEIVIPRYQAAGAIQEISHAPNRTGTIIARLIARIGKVQSNKSGGLIITIGKNSLELSKEIIDQSKSQSTENLSSNASSSVLPSKSSDSLASSRSIETIRKSRSQTSLSIKPRFLIIHDNDGTIRFYVQHTYEEERRASSVMMLPTRYPVQPTQPRLIAPEHYRDITLRDAPVYIRREGQKEVFYENLAQYLSTNQTDLSSRTIRRMLKFSSRDEYFAYLHSHVSATIAQQLVDESEESSSERSTRFTNIRARTPDNEDDRRQRSRSPGRSPQTTSGQNLTTPEKNITLPRSTTLSGQSNDGESEGRTTVSRSTSAAAKVATSKSDTIKSTTSSSAASSREHPNVTVVRTKSLVSPNRTSGSKVSGGGGGGGDEVKKEKKSKFRTPSFLRKRKEKKEAANKDKADK